MEIISRWEAKDKGLKFYFTGQPCKRGHTSERYVSGGACVECSRNYPEYNKNIKKYQKEWYQINKEHRKRKNKEWYENNKERHAKTVRKAHSERPEHYREYRKRYKKENRDKVNAYNRKYSYQRYHSNAEYKVSKIIRSYLQRVLNITKEGKEDSSYDVLGYTPAEFMDNMNDKLLEGMTWENHGEVWHIDHIIPVSRLVAEGVQDPKVINSLDNLLPMYSEHNKNKHAKTLDEFLGERPDLEYLYGRFIKT